MQSFVIGNWKMNGSKASVTQLVSDILDGISSIPQETQIAVMAPYPFLPMVQKALSKSPVTWGAQNLSANEPGAYTGEVAAHMLVDFGCTYVIVGHSERRKLYYEDDVLVSMKFAQAKRHGLTPILCVGETAEQRDADLTKQVVLAQIDAILNLEDGVKVFKDAIIAYEPVWAIGTGVAATPEEAQSVHRMIRERLSTLDAAIASELPIIYGGSVTPESAKTLFDMPDINGGLIGGASLKGHDFLEIGRCTNLS